MKSKGIIKGQGYEERLKVLKFILWMIMEIILSFLGGMTSGDREVVDFTRSRVKTKSKLTNLMKLI